MGVVTNLWSRLHDLDDRRSLLSPHRHEHARHQRKVKRHVELGLLGGAEVLHHIARPLVRLGQQDRARELFVDHASQLPQELVRLRQVLAVGPSRSEIGHRIAPKPSGEVQPVADNVEHLPVDLGIVVIQVRLVTEPMPVVLPRHRVVGPVRRLGVSENDRTPLYCVGSSVQT